MSDAASAVPAAPASQSAGQGLGKAATSGTAGSVLRAARQAQGMHISTLAASIKVTQRKLEALEADRYAELPDVAFTRALAMTICRSLKIDAEPVLALLPQLGDQGLDRVHQGLNTRFRERPGRLPPTDLSVLTRPALWLPLLAILAAVTIYLLPQGWIADLRPSADAASAMTASPPLTSASAPLAVAAAASTPLSEAGAAFPPPEAASAATAVAAELTGALQLRVSGESWVEVLDASGASLLQRALHPGEAVGLDGTPPFKVKIGNASAAQLTFRGQAVELKAVTRDNVARLELK